MIEVAQYVIELTIKRRIHVREEQSEVQLNSVGYPIRDGANVCTHFTKTGWCKFGTKCFRTHPEEALDTHYVSERANLKKKLREDYLFLDH